MEEENPNYENLKGHPPEWGAALAEERARRANGSGSDDETANHLSVIQASQVKVRPVEWFWEGRIPLGKVTVLDGSPGLAKTTIAIDLAARCTSGAPMPDGKAGTTGAVIFVGYEDDLADTLVPRFLAAGGDPHELYFADTITSEDGPRQLEIPEDIPHLEDQVRNLGAILVVIDPLMAALGIDVKTGIDHHVRRALKPLRDMAERTGAAVVLIRHLNKAVNVSDPIMRGGGSIGIIGAARAGLIVARDPEDEDRRIVIDNRMDDGDGFFGIAVEVLYCNPHTLLHSVSCLFVVV